MLEKLLALLREGGVQTTEGLARQLDVSPVMVDMMLGDLERRGYLARRGDCADACGGCDLIGECRHMGQPRLWTTR